MKLTSWFKLAMACLGLAGIALSPLSAALGQGLATQEDPRQLALDIFSSVSRGSPPETVALNISKLINTYRFRCTRVTDYQVFTSRPNLIDIKAKCSGDPLYGVTVASNGYVAVYGGNGMVSSLDRRDALIVSFAADGRLESDSRVTADEAFDETVERLQLGNEYNLMYVMSMFAALLAVVSAITLVWIKMWRRRGGKKRHHRGIKPMLKHAGTATSSAKDQLLDESTQLSQHIFKHPSGVYISRGKRGKRRFFKSRFWATVYAKLGWRMFEVSAPDPIGVPADDALMQTD